MTPQLGSTLWSLLDAFVRAYPIEATDADRKSARQFLHGFDACLAAVSGGCNCHAEWSMINAVCPPPLSGRTDLMAWRVAAQDYVNQKLGRPLHDELSRGHCIFQRLAPPAPATIQHANAARPHVIMPCPGGCA